MEKSNAKTAGTPLKINVFLPFRFGMIPTGLEPATSTLSR